MFISNFSMKVLTIVIATIVFLYFWIKRKYSFWKQKGLQTVPPKFPFGNALTLVSGKESLAIYTARLYEYLKSRNLKHGGLYILILPVYYPVDTNIIKCIMQNDFQHFMNRGFYMNEKDDPLSAHLFALGGMKWRALRNKLSPTFTPGKMKLMFNILLNSSNDLDKVMEDSIGAPVDISDISARFTVDVIGRCAFGIDCNSLIDPSNEFRHKGRAVFEFTMMENIKHMISYAIPDVMRIFRSKIVNPDSAKFFMKVVKDTVDYREENNVSRKDFMQLLIQLKNGEKVGDDNNLVGERDEANSITFNELAAQAFVFFLAGYETSSTTMTFCLLELAINREIQDKAREEIEEVLAKHNGEITYEALMELHYLEKIVKETLRKYPPLPILIRECTKDYKVPGSDVVLKSGTKVFIPVYAIQHDEQYYPDPEKFDPERFNEESEKTRTPYTYFPFGDGPRICIGLRFGMMQTKVGLTSLLKNYIFSVNAKTSLPIKLQSRSFIMYPKGSIWLDYEKIGR